MSEDVLITILTFTVPFVSGAFFAVLALTNKYSTDMKYVCYSLATWIYISLSSALSLILTLLMESIGTRVVANALLNSVFLGIVGPGVLFGIISTFTYPKPPKNDIENQLKTLQDHVYSILDKSISRKTVQIVEQKITYGTVDIDPERVMREVGSILDAEQDLTIEQKNKLMTYFDIKAQLGEYAPIIRELKKYHDVDYIIKRLSPETEQKYIRSKLRRLVHIATATNDVPPEFVIAKVQALQKAPDSSLYHLRQASQKMKLKEYVHINQADWWILASMTHGGDLQRDKLEKLLELVNIEQISLEDIKKQCAHQDMDSIKLMAAKRSNGDCVEIALKKVQDNQSHAITWWIISDGTDKEYTNLDEALHHIKASTIPIQLI